MGLFRNENEAEKTIKNLVGGFLLNSEFMNVLVKYGIESSKGYDIQKQLKHEAKNNNLKANQVSKRIQYLLRQTAGIDPTKEPLNGLYFDTVKCSKCGFDYAKDLPYCPFCNHGSSNIESETSEVKTCPNCGEVQNDSNTFCISCGLKFQDDTVKYCESDNVQESKNAFSTKSDTSRKKEKSVKAVKHELSRHCLVFYGLLF